MRLPELPEAAKRWDDHKAFHWTAYQHGVTASGYGGGMFTIFDTGEVNCVLREPVPDSRGGYKTLNVSVWLTSADTGMPALTTPDGTPVPIAWLNQVNGGQTLLVDHDTKRVIRMDKPLTAAADTRPLRFQPKTYIGGQDQRPWSGGVYFAGPGCVPVGGQPHISVPKNHKTLVSDAEREHIDTLTCRWRAEAQLSGFKPDQNPGALPFDVAMACLDPSTLTHQQKSRLIKNGVDRKIFEFDYLLAPGAETL